MCKHESHHNSPSDTSTTQWIHTGILMGDRSHTLYDATRDIGPEMVIPQIGHHSPVAVSDRMAQGECRTADRSRG